MCALLHGGRKISLDMLLHARVEVNETIVKFWKTHESADKRTEQNPVFFCSSLLRIIMSITEI